MFGNALREFITPFYPVLQESKFLTDGVLTPDEFVRAGDTLIAACPGSWSWSDSPQKVKYLPDNKQYLICSGVPCYRRVADLDASTGIDEGARSVNRMGAGDAAHDDSLLDWCVPSLGQKIRKEAPLGLNGDEVSDDAGFIVIPEGDGHEKCSPSIHADGGTEKSISATPAPSIHADGEAKQSFSAAPAPSLYAEMEESAECALDDDTTISSLQCRRYNCMVSYDKYYRVPRMWLNGWDQTGSPLSDGQMLEDVMHEYALRTVTIEAFPLADKCQARSLSIHPCNHAQAFINIIKSLQECGKTPKVEHILFIYLKFMASVVPTIDYDWSFDVEIKGTAA